MKVKENMLYKYIAVWERRLFGLNWLIRHIWILNSSVGDIHETSHEQVFMSI